MGLFDLPKELRAKIHGEKDLTEMFFKTLDEQHDLGKALTKIFKTTDKETMLTVAVIGRSGAGKSSLVNALAGLKGAKAAPTGRKTDKTTVPGEYNWGKIKLVDFPGYDTVKYNYTDFIKQFDFMGYDLILNVMDSKISEAMKEVHNVMISKRTNYLVVRANLDSIQGGPEEIRQDKDDIIKDIREKLQYTKKVYFVCCHPRSEKYKEGVEDLQEYIKDLARGKMKEIKSKRCRKIIDVIKQEYINKCKAKELDDNAWGIYFWSFLSWTGISDGSKEIQQEAERKAMAEFDTVSRRLNRGLEISDNFT